MLKRYLAHLDILALVDPTLHVDNNHPKELAYATVTESLL